MQAAVDCPSSDDSRLFRCLRNGGSGSPGFEAMRPAGDAASVFGGWSGAWRRPRRSGSRRLVLLLCDDIGPVCGVCLFVALSLALLNRPDRPFTCSRASSISEAASSSTLIARRGHAGVFGAAERRPPPARPTEQAQKEAEIEPKGVSDDLSGKSMAAIERITVCDGPSSHIEVSFVKLTMPVTLLGRSDCLLERDLIITGRRAHLRIGAYYRFSTFTILVLHATIRLVTAKLGG